VLEDAGDVQYSQQTPGVAMATSVGGGDPSTVDAKRIKLDVDAAGLMLADAATAAAAAADASLTPKQETRLDLSASHSQCRLLTCMLNSCRGLSWKIIC